MEENKYNSKNTRIRLEPKLRSSVKREEDLFPDEDLEVRLLNREKFIKKNIVRLILCTSLFAVIYAANALPFSTTRKITQGVKWAMNYEIDFNEEIPNDNAVITTISNQIQEWTGIQRKGIQKKDTDTKYLPPVEGTVTSPFGDKIHPIFKTEIEARGIEISTKSSSDIQAIDQGKIVSIQKSVDGGKKITIQHNNSMKSIYEGCYESSLRIDEQIQRGDIIGKTKTIEKGHSSILYFELWKGDQAVDPLDYMDLKVDTAN